MRKFLFLYILFASVLLLQASPKYEMRAVWLTTNWGLDWPSVQATDATQRAKQQKELCDILDKVADMGLNTVFFQARIPGEVFYDSSFEPWSHIASGKAGVSPGYDPLEYAVEECHRRGLECHAWLVTIPLGSLKQAQRHGQKSVPMQHPELCVKLKKEWYLNPGHPGTASYLAQIAREIARNYAVDGIHLDYIRYPAEKGAFPDNATYKKYAPKGISLAQWRMDNITAIVDSVYHAVKTADPSIMVSTAPLGRYASLDDDPRKGWVCLGGASQDPVAWLQAGINDFVAPMMYYEGDNFYPYVADWQQRVGDDGRVVVGLGAYRMEKNEGNWSLDELKGQMKASRKNGVSGQAFFRYRHLQQFQLLARFLKEKYYRYPALIPPMRTTEVAPLAVVGPITYQEDSRTLVWQPIDGAVRYVVYASTGDDIDTENPAHILSANVVDTQFVLPSRDYRIVAVSAIDVYRCESDAMCITIE